MQLETHEKRVAALAADNAIGRDVRTAALTALANLDASNHAESLGHVLADPAAPIELREQAATLLTRGNRPDTAAELMRVLPTAPARLQNGIAAGLAASKEGAEQLLAAVASGKASARLLQERAVEVKLRATKLPDLKERLAELTAGLPAPDQKLTDLLKQRRDGFLTLPNRTRPWGAKCSRKVAPSATRSTGRGRRSVPNSTASAFAVLTVF